MPKIEQNEETLVKRLLKQRDCNLSIVVNFVYV